MLLLIDNYDSFTYNLAHCLGELGAEVRVVRNDRDVEGIEPSHLVISPGPGRPESAGQSIDLIRKYAGRIPVLGVCLGHQAISIAFGGRVERAERLMHGKTSRISHDDSVLFNGLPLEIDVGRYHSLAIPDDAMPDGFVCSAKTVQDGTVMAIRHQQLPIFGVQFHPESVLTPAGPAMLRNFLSCSALMPNGSQPGG